MNLFSLAVESWVRKKLQHLAEIPHQCPSGINAVLLIWRHGFNFWLWNVKQVPTSRLGRCAEAVSAGYFLREIPSGWTWPVYSFKWSFSFRTWGGGEFPLPLPCTPGFRPFPNWFPLKICFSYCKVLRSVAKKSNFTWLPPPWVSRLPPSFLPPPVDFPPSLLTGSRLPAPSPQPSHHMYKRSAVLAPLALW